jgi:hypothetical protein
MVAYLPLESRLNMNRGTYTRVHGVCKTVTLVRYSRVSFCDGSFYEESLLRLLSGRTQHLQLVVHHCRNSSVVSLLSALLALFRCACVSFLCRITSILSVR